MKKILVFFLLMSMSLINGQKIGEMAPEKPAIVFPDNSWGMDIMFSDGGFGIGTFFRKTFSDDFTGFVDFSISESKDDREIEFIDIFGRTFTRGKANRVFLLPVNLGIQYRLFSKSLTDNLRPYINFGAGPTVVVTTPYEEEFFKAFGKARTKYAAGGYVGFGANFGISKKNLVGINLRYYVVRLFDEGVENLEGKFRKDLGGFFLTINVGIMY